MSSLGDARSMSMAAELPRCLPMYATGVERSAAAAASAQGSTQGVRISSCGCGGCLA
jgi:hypothetical protein